MNILVLEKFAHLYTDLLGHLPDKIEFSDSLPDGDRNHDVLLAQPDLAAEYLIDGGQPSWIQSTWAGVRPVLEVMPDKGIALTGIKGVFGPQMAEYVFSYILAELRQPEQHRANQANHDWQPILPDSLSGQHMVIVGTGSIGAHIATVARQFGLRVTGVSRSGSNVTQFHRVLPVSALNEAVVDADYVILVLPDTPATIHVFNAQTFSAMHKQPLLVNVGRGNSIDEVAMLQALRNGNLRGAVLDVFDIEPLPKDSPLWSEPGVVITPHIAAVSFPRDITRVFEDNLRRFKAGQPLQHEVDLNRGY